jgi:hypothetical protein
MEDEDLIDFAEARPSGLHSLKLPASWVDKPVLLVPAGREMVQASHHHQRTSQIRSPEVKFINVFFDSRSLR